MADEIAHFEDPVGAYDRLAGEYEDLSAQREPYLRSVERQILPRIPANSRSMLDIGAGNGSRTFRIAQEAGIANVVLVEPSARMSESAHPAKLWRIRAEDLDVNSLAERFDLITCLWNVLGHIPSHEKRIRVLSTASELLTPRGRFFIDVIHRYNARSYGWFATAGRVVRDAVTLHPKNGDVVARWKLKDGAVSTYGHVFTHREVMALARAAGLEMVERLVVDYGTGKLCRSPFRGNLFYVFRRTSAIDSSSAPHTS